MATRYDRLFARASKANYWLNSEPAQYRARGVTRPQPVSVIVERDLSRYGDAAAVQGKSAIVEVLVSEVPERPRKSETFTLESGEALTVDSVLTSDGFVHRCVVS